MGHVSQLCLIFYVFPLFCLDCILVGSLVWGLWSNRNGVSIYYKVYITELTKTHMTLSRKYHYPRRFRRTNSKLIIDEIPEKKEILEKPRVIAPYTYFGPERYKSGRVTYIDTFSVQVTFDDNTKRYFTLRNALAKMRLIRRPSFCWKVRCHRGLVKEIFWH